MDGERVERDISESGEDLGSVERYLIEKGFQSLVDYEAFEGKLAAAVTMLIDDDIFEPCKSAEAAEERLYGLMQDNTGWLIQISCKQQEWLVQVVTKTLTIETVDQAIKISELAKKACESNA